MSTSDGRRVAFAAAALASALLASCTLAPEHCIRMSDCDDGTTCVEGRCEGASATSADITTADAAADGAMTDAASDR